jgi:mono/diheme cytochrome c family protein
VSRLLQATVMCVLLAPAIGPRGVMAQPTPSRDVGQRLYAEHCASCHGSSGRGDGPAADSMRRTPSDLTRYAQANGGVFPEARLRRIIDGREVGAHGSVEMPVWGVVFKAEGNGGADAARTRIDAILAYVRAMQERAGDE